MSISCPVSDIKFVLDLLHEIYGFKHPFRSFRPILNFWRKSEVVNEVLKYVKKLITNIFKSINQSTINMQMNVSE